MFKIFDSHRQKLTTLQVGSLGKNKGFIIINTITGNSNIVTGDLYAICDYNIEDMEKYNGLIAKLVKSNTPLLIGNTFDQAILVEE